MSGAHQFADHGGTFASVELHADLIREGRVADGRHDRPGGRGRRYIQGNDETLARVHKIFGLPLPSVSVLVRIGYGLQQRQVSGLIDV